ncbi:MAG: hypothetical protein II323_00860 [Tidjanibacter sp.]|nr:hypothetical protein [Tidjanibacter sp.]
MKKVVIKSMVVLSLVMGGTFNTTNLMAQTQETQQVEETPAQRKAREKAEKKAAKEAEKARKAAEKAEKARKAEEEKIAKIIAAQKAAAAKNGVVEEQKPATTYGPEWGENATAAEREENLRIFNFFSDAYNNKDYDKALEYMYTLINNCPKARSSVYANGSNIYRNKIARAASLAEKSVYIDSLMKVYDYRLAAFADDKEYGEVYILKNKAKDYYKYRSEDKQGMLDLFRKAIEKDPEVDPTFINQYFTVLVEEYEALNVETDHFMNEYEFMANKMDGVTDPEAKTTFDALLIKSGAADCNNLETIFSDRLKNNPDDAALIGKVYRLLLRNNCQSAFFLEVGEKNYAINPTTVDAQILSRAFEANNMYDKALEYLRAAVEMETDPILKSNLCAQISGTELSAGAAREAANFAKMALEFNADNGTAYICLAQAYVDGANGCDDFGKQTVFWLASDLVAKARTLFEGNEKQQDVCNQLLSTYRGYFPKQADCFFRGLQDGDAYNVNCGWVSGGTTVRAAK